MPAGPIVYSIHGSGPRGVGLDKDGYLVCRGITPREGIDAEYLDETAIDTSALIASYTAPAWCNYIRTAGRAAVGDGGEALWKRVEAQPDHAGYRASANGVYFELCSQIIFVEQIGSPTVQNDRNSAASIAFALDRPLWITQQTVSTFLDLDLTNDADEDTPESRHLLFMQACDWHGKCRLPNNSELVIRLANGYHSVSAWNALGTGTPIVRRINQFAPVLHIRGSSATILTIASITIGARGQSDYTLSPPVIRYANDYPITIVATSAFPSYVVRGYAIGLQNVTGDNDAQCLSGAVVVETISADRLTITATITSLRTADLVSPTTIDTTTTYGGILPSRLVVPTACLGIDTTYTVATAKTVTGVTRGATTTITVGAGHSYTAGQQVRFSGVGGTTELNGQQLVVAAPITATEFNVNTLNSAALDSSGYSAFTSGGSVSQVTQVWTGGDFEGYFEFINGARGETRTVGMSWVGYTGSVFAQEIISVVDSGSRILVSSSSVLSGAGSRIIRAAFGAQVNVNAACMGNGGCQYAIGLQGVCNSSVIRSWVGGARQYLFIVSDESHMNVSLSTIGGASAAVSAQGLSYVTILSARVVGCLTGLFPLTGGVCRVDSTTQVNLNTTGLSRSSTTLDLGRFEGTPTFGTAAFANGTDQNFTDGSETISTDAAFTLTSPTSAPNILHTGVLTVARAVTLATSSVRTGAEFCITRTGTGAFPLNIGTGPLVALYPNQWCRVRYDGSAWYLASFGAVSSETRVINTNAKVGATAGWVIGGGAVDTGLMATLPELQTNSTLVVPVPVLLNQTIKGFYAIGEIEASGGGDVSITVNLRKFTAVTGGPTDASVGTVTLSHTAASDVVMNSSNTGVTGLTEVVAETETFYFLITATTAGGSDIALQGVALTVGT